MLRTGTIAAVCLWAAVAVARPTTLTGLFPESRVTVFDTADGPNALGEVVCRRLPCNAELRVGWLVVKVEAPEVELWSVLGVADDGSVSGLYRVTAARRPPGGLVFDRSPVFALASRLQAEAASPQARYMDAVARALRLPRNVADACKIRVRDPDFPRGRVTVRWTIDADGTADMPEVLRDRSEGLSEALEKCLAEGVVRTRFPPPPNGRATIVYPWVFRGPEDPARLPPRIPGGPVIGL